MDSASPRDLVTETVTRRATHTELDQVTDTLSLWSAERIVTGEYHGRFLIELLQNARDALLADDPAARSGTVRIRLTDQPALVVCNDGVPLKPEVLLHSIGKFGQGTKPHGEAIGHKGIGFKAVLEVSLTPEIYSSRDGDDYGLRARFDPLEARRLVRQHSPHWSELVAASPGADGPAAVDRIPVLRFPAWIEDGRDRLGGAERIDGRAFDTVIRLPFDERYARELQVDRARFVELAQQGMAGVSDQMVLLLGAFGRVILEDETRGTTVTIEREERAAEPLTGGGTRRRVDVRRDGEDHSRWMLFERRLPGLPGLEGDVAVGVQLQERDGATGLAGPSVVPADAGDAFHLFFPTRIATHLPFLLHAYFEVNASRTGFAPSEAERNERLLDGLRALAVAAVGSLVEDDAAGRLDASGLAGLIGSGSGPDDPLAAGFHERLLADLDAVAWVPVRSVPGAPDHASPSEVLAEPDETTSDLLPSAFPPDYLHRRLGLRYPSPVVGPTGLRYLAERGARARGGTVDGLGEGELRRLLTPGEDPLWGADAAAMDAGFRALVQVLGRLGALRPETEAVVDDLLDDPAACIIPVLDDAPPGRRLRPPTGPSRPGDRAAAWILARLGQASAASVAPPRSLGLDFLDDGLLDDRLLSSAQPLGIREYRTETVLDAIENVGRSGADSAAMSVFAWRLLLRDTASSFAVSNADELSGVFDPGRWFWSRPGLRSDTERDELRRGARTRAPRAPLP